MRLEIGSIGVLLSFQGGALGVLLGWLEVLILGQNPIDLDIIIGLSGGADDYLTKAFSPRELMVRIKAALRRLRAGDNLTDSLVMRFQFLRINPAGHRVWGYEQKVELTSPKWGSCHTPPPANRRYHP